MVTISLPVFMDPGNYNVHSKPVHYLDGLEDAVYFRGSTIELHCHASCGKECVHHNKLYHNGLPELSHELTDNTAKLTLRISDAGLNDSGFYQCFLPVWPWKGKASEISGRKIHVQIAGTFCGI